MEKNAVSSKSKLTKVLVVFYSLLLLFITVLVGYSFFSIKNEKQHLKTVIDLSNNQLDKQEYFDSIENAKFSYELDKSKGSRYPVLVVKQNSKYGVLSRSLFGSSIILQSIEV